MQVTFRSYPETARMKKHKRASSLKEDKTLCSSARNLSLVGQQKEQLIQAVRMQVTSQSYPEAAWMKRQRKNPSAKTSKTLSSLARKLSLVG